MQNRKQSKLDQVKREAPFLSVHYLLPNPQLSLSLSICCSVYLLPACMLTLGCVCVCVLCVYLKKTKPRSLVPSFLLYTPQGLSRGDFKPTGSGDRLPGLNFHSIL